MTSVPKSEFNEEFVEMMRSRMLVSFHKYGPIRDAYPHKVDAIASLQTRLREYERTGNTEFLIDAANFAMIEFMCPSHDQSHFRATDANASPGRNWHMGGRPNQRPNS
ncbi:hypothetical protein K227x_62150 [Rubripirellula lacrimiformis]|uniref:Uncharacterized protein n=1 Tax=Rubripirellula lacrimiformis TaxID=1930273 RepID=A0A517NKW4_9BACT|nr:hypothetical protein K227x_62150 [Rubripirellula lacrimiformis]